MVHEDKVRGVIYGQAIGDSLGLPCEYKPASWVAARYPDGGPFTFEAVDRNVFGYRETWEPGEWSDDTEQALCLLDGYLAEGGITKGVAARFQHWLATTTRGAGRLTRTVLTAPGYREEPWEVAARIWKESPPIIPPNGAVMRTSYIGIMRPWDIAWTQQAAVDAARLTHADPQCVASAVAVSIAVARLVSGWSPQDAIRDAMETATMFDPEVRVWMQRDLDQLALDEGLDAPGRHAHADGSLPRPRATPVRVGHTYKTLGAAFWALRVAEGEVLADHYGTQPVKREPIFSEVLCRVIRAGGDTDTNGAVAGALLGAWLGAKGMPKHLVEGLRPKQALDDRFMSLLMESPTATVA